MGCAICLEEYEADNANPALQAVALRCGHIFHQKCIQDWLSSRASAKERCCAMCKAPSDFEQYARSVQAAAAPNAAVPSNEYIVLYPAEMEEIDKFLQQRNAHVARCREIQRRREAAGGTGGGAADEAEQKREEEQLGLLLDFRMHLNAFVMGVYRENAKTVDFAALKLIREVALLKGEEGTAALKDSIAALNKLHKKLYERYQRTKHETERLRQAAASHEAQLAQRVQAATEHERTAHRKLRVLDKREKELDARQVELSVEAQRAQGEAQTLALKRRELEEQYQETKRMRVETQQALAMKEQRLKAECDERLGAMQREVDEAREACATDERARIHAEQEREAAVAKSLRLAKQLAPLTRTLEEVRRKKDEYKAAVEAAKLPLREEILTLKKKLALATSGASQASASGSSSSNGKVARKASSFSRSSRAPEDAATSAEMEWDDSSFSNNSTSLARAQRQADASHAKARASFASAKARSSFNSSSASAAPAAAAAGNESSLIVEAEDLSSEFNGIHDAFRPPPVAVPRSALRNSVVNANSNTHASASGSGSGSKLQPAKRVKSISPLKKSLPLKAAASPAKPSAPQRAPEFNNEVEVQLDASPSAGLIFQSRTSSSAAFSRNAAEVGAAAQPASSQAPHAHKRRRVYEADGECVYTGASSSSSSSAQQQKQKQRERNDKAASFFSPASSAPADDDLPDAKDALSKVFLDMRKDREEGERDAGLGRRATSGLAVLGPKRKVRSAAWAPS